MLRRYLNRMRLSAYKLSDLYVKVGTIYCDVFKIRYN